MKKLLMLMLGCGLLGAAPAAAQEAIIRTSLQSGYLGIRYDDTQIWRGGDNSGKVVIREVSKGSPAEKVGLRAGDEILRINGLSAGNGKFAAVARTLTEGDTVKLRIKREGNERDYTVVAGPRPAGYSLVYGDRTMLFTADSVRGLMKKYLDSAKDHLDSLKLPRVWVHPGDSAFDIRIERFGKFPDSTIFFRRDSAVFGKEFRMIPMPPPDMFHFEEMGYGPIIRSIEVGSRAIAGAEFTTLDPAMKPYFGTDRGLLTLRVAPETPAARAGLVAGDIIVKANDRGVTTVPELRRILLTNPETLKLEVLRNRETKTLDVPIERKRRDD